MTPLLKVRFFALQEYFVFKGKKEGYMGQLQQ